jgi:hypothetical protein
MLRIVLSRLLPGFLAIAIALVFTACATKKPSPVVGAVTAPLTDLNLLQTEIPEVLIEARKQPYAYPSDTACSCLIGMIENLDAVLGPDLNAPKEAEQGWFDKGTDQANKATVGAIRRTTESLVPFRSWVRKLTGAESRSKQYSDAIAAGIVRRAFLKGLAVARGCALPIPDSPESSPTAAE